jgi:hypothetical protein
MTTQRQLIEAEFDLDYALQWGDMVGVRKSSARIKELEKAVRQERVAWIREQFRNLFSTFNPLRYEGTTPPPPRI